MPKSGHYKVSILVNGVPLQEYDPPEDDDLLEAHDPDTVVKYIEAIEGAEFGVKIEVARSAKFPGDGKSTYLDVDGKPLYQWSIRPASKHRSREGWSSVRYGKTVYERGAYLKRTFTFKHLHTTEDNAKVDQYKHVAKYMGQLRLRVFDVVDSGEALARAELADDEGTVPEKVLKGRAIDMSVGLGAAQRTSPIRWIKSTRISGALVTFVFAYRSRRALQMLDLVPTSPSPQSLQLEERDPNTLNLDEARQLLTQIHQERQDAARSKREQAEIKAEEQDYTPTKRSAAYSDDDDCQIVEVKRRKATRPDEVEVLDLS